LIFSSGVRVVTSVCTQRAKSNLTTAQGLEVI
jgi:hypothetical protein